MPRLVQRLWRSNRAAVAPIVALSMFGLIACGGIAFDYAHMATLDTELQQAADQAALAAATQLDGLTGAQTRAAAAANSLLRNTALFAASADGPTGDTSRITVPTLTFYKSYDEASDTGVVTVKDDEAKAVMVQVGTRRANFALTPIVGVLESGDMTAQAVAGLGGALCKVPPLMICAPSSNFPTPADVGKGVLLEPGSGSAWVAGNYGYLSFGSGARDVKQALGANNDVEACVGSQDGVPTKPGNTASVPGYLNTRFDLYANSIPRCNSANGDYCPAENTRKDLSRTEVVKIDGNAAAAPANPGCGAAAATIADFALDSAVKGYPRDTNQPNCGSTNSCPKFGNGVWNRDAYVANQHPAFTVATLAAAIGKTAATLSRWDIYKWELANKPGRLATKLLNAGASPEFKEQGNSGEGTYTFTNRCEYPQPKNGTAVVAGANQKDRRLLTVAIVDCTGQTGAFDAKVLRFADMFLVEPSLTRPSPGSTDKDQIYGEVVSVSTRANGQSAFQYYLRQRPRLLR